MKQLFTICLLFLISFWGFGQAEGSDPQEPLQYILSFDGEDVTNWEDFELFVKNITQAESIELNDSKSGYIISTERTLDPKIVQGKLFKYGVDYIELKLND